MPPKILIVDDEPDNISFVSTVLEENGYTDVDSALNAVEGMKKLRANKPALLILDILMPQKSGFAMFSEMRNDPELKDIPVIMLTGVGKETGIDFAGGEKVKEYVGRKPEFFLDKPIEPELLADAVNKALA